MVPNHSGQPTDLNQPQPTNQGLVDPYLSFTASNLSRCLEPRRWRKICRGFAKKGGKGGGVTTQRSKVAQHLFVGFSVCSCPIELCLVLFVTLKMLFEMTFNSSSVYLCRKKNFSCLPQTGDFRIYLFWGGLPQNPLGKFQDAQWGDKAACRKRGKTWKLSVGKNSPSLGGSDFFL